GATLSNGAAKAASGGIVTFATLSVDKAAAYTLTASGGGLTKASAGFTVNARAEERRVGKVRRANVTAGATKAQVEVRGEGAHGGTATGVCAWVGVACTSAGGATLSNGAAKAASGGIVTFATLSVDKAAAYTLTASGGGLTKASAGFTVNA